ncbi:hypothetical protein MZG50_22960, partial [Escherichia coli]|nr:hypothetical protein [Escherichia coli]MCK2884279.1 hypothetical protein [Escherichia coli]MCK2908611.1 hypothetical protein [Escherichia coli]MCK2951647.1 hypothetical protein [Escherichia coli]MCK2966117.1 hypothetical protein [Escherichia coli]
WEKQKGSRGIRRGQWYRLVFQFPIRQAKYADRQMERKAEVQKQLVAAGNVRQRIPADTQRLLRESISEFNADADKG